MTTKLFIEKALLGTTKTMFCSSVYASTNTLDGETTVYSYGRHYPLVKIIDDKAFINDKGYSVTTGKHIGWAFSAASNVVGWDNCYHAPLFDGGSLNQRDITASATKEYDRLQREMDAKKRKDTHVYEWLQYQQDRMTATLEAIK